MRAPPVPGSGDAIANYPPTQQVDTHTTHAPAASASPASARRRGSGARRWRQRGGARLRLGPPFRWAHVLLGILQSAPYAVLAEEAVLPQDLLLLLLLPALLLLELVAGGRDAQLKLGVVQRGLDDEREAPL